MLRKNKKEGKKKIDKVSASNRFELYDKDPFFLKKDEEAIEFLKKVGFPEEFYEKKKKE